MLLLVDFVFINEVRGLSYRIKMTIGLDNLVIDILSCLVTDMENSQILPRNASEKTSELPSANYNPSVFDTTQ